MGAENNPLTDLLTEREVAQFLKVSPDCLRHWRMVGKGPRFKKLGQSLIRYEATELQRWLESQKNG